MKKNRSSILVASVLAVTLVLWMASGLLLSGKKNKEQNSENKAEKPLFRVRAIESTATLISRETTVNARTEANREVIILAEVSGQVLEVGAERGTFMHEGDMIATLEQRDRQARFAQAEAVLRQKTLEAESARKLAESGLKSQSELASAQASAEAAQAELTTAKLDMERAVTRAPFDGMLAERYVEKGDYLSPGTKVAKVVDLNPIRITGYLTELEIVGVRPGKKARAKLSTGEKLEGAISYISPEADTQSRMYKVEMNSPNPDNAIRAGVTTELVVPHDQTLSHFVSPAYILLADDGTIGLMLADAEGLTSFCPINIVNTTSDGIWVDGMPEKAIIITQGKDFITSGQKVELVIENKTEAAPEAGQPTL